MVLLYEMVAGAEGHKMCIVGGRRNGHAARTAHVRMAQLIRQRLQLVCREAVIVPENMVVRRATRTLK